ncbi:MAG TPA: PadR family transcriptional regulator [Lacipirellulaceae bacterium]|jgi:PadR family transcriptional regulator PadR|nr:PadR family transcriptional regulator [Lacipirellulaceae bacterium]
MRINHYFLGDKMKLERELMRGAAPTAVMQVLSAGEKYGYELVEALARQSNGVLGVGQSTLYPLLYNLEAKGLVTSRVDETGARPRRFYRLTQLGRRKLADETKQWQALWEAFRSLGIAGQPSTMLAGGAR